MLSFTHKIPHNTPFKIGFSGGIDSLVLAHFYRRNPNAILCHFNHGCEYSDAIEASCKDRASDLGMMLVVGRIKGKKAPKQSLEDFWRRERYKFLYSVNGEHVLTAHHLNDAVETWCMSSFHGESKLISPKQRVNDNNTIQILHRPLLLTTKKSLQDYGKHHHLIPVPDPYNDDESLARNYFRKNLITPIEHLNPGIEKVIRKKYLNLNIE